MRFEVLGPLRVCTDDGEVAIRLGRERVLLAVLLLRAGTTVLVEQLIDAHWPEAPPGATARGSRQLMTTIWQNDARIMA